MRPRGLACRGRPGRYGARIRVRGPDVAHHTRVHVDHLLIAGADFFRASRHETVDRALADGLRYLKTEAEWRGIR